MIKRIKNFDSKAENLNFHLQSMNTTYLDKQNCMQIFHGPCQMYPI